MIQALGWHRPIWTISWGQICRRISKMLLKKTERESYRVIWVLFANTKMSLQWWTSTYMGVCLHWGSLGIVFPHCQPRPRGWEMGFCWVSCSKLSWEGKPVIWLGPIQVNVNVIVNVNCHSQCHWGQCQVNVIAHWMSFPSLLWYSFLSDTCLLIMMVAIIWLAICQFRASGSQESAVAQWVAMVPCPLSGWYNWVSGRTE